MEDEIPPPKKNLTMPKIRDITIATGSRKQEILDLTKDYMEVIPGSTQLRYCDKY